MLPEIGFLARYKPLAGSVFLVLTSASGLAVLTQISLAGEDSMIEPDEAICNSRKFSGRVSSRGVPALLRSRFRSVLCGGASADTSRFAP
jgi:hypothetical protein